MNKKKMEKSNETMAEETNKKVAKPDEPTAKQVKKKARNREYEDKLARLHVEIAHL